MINLPSQIELRPIDALRPYPRNSRKHSDEQVAQVAASIIEFGWTSPILLDGDNGADLRQHDSKSIRRKPNGMPCYGAKGKP